MTTKTYTTFEAARAGFQRACEDTAGDLGVTLDELDEYAWDLCTAIAYECTPEVAFELCRVELGAIPAQVLKLYPSIKPQADELDDLIG